MVELKFGFESRLAYAVTPYNDGENHVDSKTIFRLSILGMLVVAIIILLSTINTENNATGGQHAITQTHS